MEKQKNCCGEKKSVKDKNSVMGIMYGVFPHIGCIAFIVGSILGVTVLTQLFKPLLMNPYLFHILILMSLVFATLSSLLYLKSNGFLSIWGIKQKWKYLGVMYGSTIGINILLIMFIFPLLANITIDDVQSSQLTANMVSTNQNIKLEVDIPCSGHALLISNELKTINGVNTVRFDFPNIFNVEYDSTTTSEQEILSLEVFETYNALVLSKNVPEGESCGVYEICDE
ncbi:hypothetical protein KO465_05285 [Candidatus Micrarchaeota archaeon]|nr:hypothetical protein [Candidatus Micrarchaeota archaeon]